MVYVNSPPEGFFRNPLGVATPCHPSNTTSSSSSEDTNKKIRKPYTITKSRECWTEQEHDKFLEALQLFDRDWKKIEAFIGSKTVIQIRSHAQKYFMKVQKKGTKGHVPPPRPKRKESHSYPHKTSKNDQNMELSGSLYLENLSAALPSQATPPFQSSSCLLEPGYALRIDSSSMVRNSTPSALIPSWPLNSLPPATVSHTMTDDIGPPGATSENNCCSSSMECPPGTWSTCDTTDLGNHGPPLRVMPDFSQVYTFIGSVFDPNTSGHLQKLKQMDPVNIEAALLLMKNLSINLSTPNFKNHRRRLSSYEVVSLTKLNPVMPTTSSMHMTLRRF
ncbi:protein REVEILLE 6-like isoform X2 [Magnolia sinica]|uniref:protein REVEILLE 6-like isoform X2 n=1 Tax=Magnolia sinica TaxID=86752 RepID=UPI00265AE641|nr:protein REVEILLE 6-like isoform X2 [Magnolia sinica]